MGLWEFLQQWPRGRIVAGAVASVLLHLTIVGVLYWAGQLPMKPRWVAKPGDALIVELPKPDEPAPAGSPTARVAPGPPVAPATPTPDPAPSRPERRVARAVQPPEPARPAPRPAEPAPRPAEPTQRTPRPEAAPPPAATTPRTPDAPGPAEPEARSVNAPPANVTPPVAASAPAPPSDAGGNRQVASVPPGGAAAAPPPTDIRSALRRGAGGPGGGRGGIEGDAIALDAKDARYSDFLEKVRQRIKAQWGYPCVKNFSTRECEYLSAQLVVEFGILRNGDLQFVDVIHSSGYEIYDGYAVTAIRLASPYPKVPAEMMALMKPGSTGTVIAAKFNYIAETSLTNIR
jgi:TonB family protein